LPFYLNNANDDAKNMNHVSHTAVVN